MTITDIARNYRVSRRVVAYHVDKLKTTEGIKFRQDPVTRTHIFDDKDIAIIGKELENCGYCAKGDADMK